MQNLAQELWKAYEIEHTGSIKGVCLCCGATTQRISGVVNDDDKTLAAYSVGWTPERPDHGVVFDLILGRWGRGSRKRDRFRVTLGFRVVRGAPVFTIIDGSDRPPLGRDLFDKDLQRSQVIDTPLAPQVFALADAVYMEDQRLEELHRW